MDAKERSTLAPHVLKVLKDASRGRGQRPHYISAYQIVDRLPEVVRTPLLARYGPGGKGAGRADTAPMAVANVIKYELASQVEPPAYFDAGGASFAIDGQSIDAGYTVIGLYRVRDEAEDDAP